MSASARPRLPLFHRLMAGLILVAGAIASVVSYRVGREEERNRAEIDFTHRAVVRQALAREILGRFDDSLFGLSTLFMLDGNVNRGEFARATARLEERLAGAQAFEWVAFVPAENRAAVEAAMRHAYGHRDFEFKQFDAAQQPVRAAERPYYYPICFIQPLRGNEAALGYDLTSGPTLAFLERARETRQAIVTSAFKLVQEKGNELAVVMICPVFRAARTSATNATNAAPAATPAAPDVFLGFVQCVFRLHDLLETVRAPQTETVLDMLVVDGSETDPAKRILYYGPADATAARNPPPSEAEFRAGVASEFALPFGQRNWRVIFRPRAGWIDEQRTSTPFLRSCSLMLLSTLLAGLVHVLGRQTGTIRREVTERTAELTESRRQFATLLHTLPGMAYRCTYDDQLNVVFVSEGARALTGWPAEDFISGAIHFRDLIHPDDVARVREATRGALQDRADVEIEYRIRPRDGAEKWVLSRGRGVYTADGKLGIFEGLAIDITAQKEAEQARIQLERKLLEGQKLESLGLLAGGIAHDFNNLLSSIVGNASMARLSLPAGQSAADSQLRAIENASLRAAELCRQMLAYAGKGRFVVEPVNLTTLTEELLPLLRISLGQHAALDLRLAPDLPAAMADATQLRQIVMNLVLNAADAIAASGQPHGTIALSTGTRALDAALLAGCVTGAGLPAGDYVFLEVHDTGCGMTPDVLAKIFDPFFTTKFAGRGLGLAAVLGIMRSHHGALQVTSVPGRGSTFRIFLPPVAAPTATPRPAAPAEAGRWTHSGCVLIVEDEEPVRHIMVEILKSFGFTVRDAANGTEGIALFRADPAAFDLVLLDLLMPGVNGEQVLAALRALRPDVRVLLMSGYTEGDVLSRIGEGGPAAFIGKPFTRDALERKLRELLD
ncbi:MAG TPA: CHASE domain-containing protein [Opitutaceae bacterium]|nr:CHASE domain-containing protein [Opitutaceae bacterium]